jgi:hypothetical protein
VIEMWELYRSRGLLRVRETSCCGLYEWASEGGVFFVLRYVKGVGYQETGRGRYRDAREVWARLIAEHACFQSKPLRR